MRSQCPDDGLIVDTDIMAFFQDRVENAASNQHLDASQDSLHYVVNLLTVFSHSRELFETTPDGPMIRPLASFYADAVSATTTEERRHALKRLGDIALFVAGVFADSLNRKLVDVDYYIAMGGNAYGYLSDTVQNSLRWRCQGPIFDELSGKFTAFVDLLDEVSEHAHFRNHGDIMRLYELWMRTGSDRALSRLRRLGIEPSQGSVSCTQH